MAQDDTDRRVLGIVLAGGRSTRFGSDKSEVQVRGVAMLARVREVLGGVAAEVLVVGGHASELAEIEPGAGPLQAVIAGLREAVRRGASGAIVLGCDLPLIDLATVRRLAAPLPEDKVGRVPRVEGYLQVLAAHWSVAAVPHLESAWQAGERSLRRAATGLMLEVDDDWDALTLVDVDTPDELARLVGRPVEQVRIRRWPSAMEDVDQVAREEPLEIVLEGRPLAVLLRTPSGAADDLALVAGFLLAEGVIDRKEDLEQLAPCRDPAVAHRDNRVLVTLAPGVRMPDGTQRSFVTSASCGLCGKATIDSLARRLPPRPVAAAPRSRHIQAMGAAMRAAQPGFSATGSLHAAGLFDGARLLDSAEDLGRHNAVDKLFGRALLRRELPLAGRVLWVSGRTSFELVQKALVAGVDALVAGGGPTSLAVELARTGGLHLIGFARGERFNVYAGSVSAT